MSQQPKQKFSDRQIEEYKAAFSLFDKDGDGTISATEFGTILRSLGQNPKEDELKDMMSRFDGDGGGSIDFAEFLDLIAGKMKTFGENESSIRRAFRSLDKDHSGYITVKELKEVLNKLGEKMTTKEVQELVNEADSNGDGRIDIDEFVVLMMSN